MVRCPGSAGWVAVSSISAALSLFGGAVTRVGAATTSTTDIYALYPDCEGEVDHIGDGYCDSVTNNNNKCGFDGGDCCECDCVVPADATDTQKEYLCVQFYCEDTSSTCYVVPAPTPAPVVEEEAEAEMADSSATTISGVTTSAAVLTLAGLFAVALGM